MGIFILRTTVGRENAVMTSLFSRIKNSGIEVKSLLRPDELKGYIFVEAELHVVENAIQGTPHVRGIIKKPVPIGEVAKFLENKKVEILVNRGDIIEITGGAFKNEKGKVVRVDESKDELTLELLDAAIPIPITISIDQIRILEKASE